jgi:DNA-binding MarR family transcriptional regulator
MRQMVQTVYAMRSSTRPVSALEQGILESYDLFMQNVAGAHATDFLGLEVTMSQAKVLYIVAVRPGMSISELAAELGVGLSAVSGLVDRLVAADLLRRHEDPSDRRQHRLELTDTGTLALERMRELGQDVLRRLLAGMTTAELTALRDGLAALLRESRQLPSAMPALTQPERTSR